MVVSIMRSYGVLMNPFDKYEAQNIALKGDLSILSVIHQPEEFPHREPQINTTVKSLGRYGRTRYIKITGRENDIKRFIPAIEQNPDEFRKEVERNSTSKVRIMSIDQTIEV